MKLFVFVILFLTSMVSAGQSIKHKSLQISWKQVTELPATGNTASIGLAGPVNGTSNGVFIVAGGANFPAGMPWQGGKKVFHDQLFVLQKKEDGLSWYKKVDFRLPEPIAYSGVTSTAKGILYAGGENESGISGKVYLVCWSEIKHQVVTKSMPDLPLALTNIAAAHIGNKIFLAGGDESDRSSKYFLCLDLDDANAHWQKLPDLPEALANASLVAVKEKLYLVGGRSRNSNGISTLHHTTFVYDPEANWQRCADISDGKNKTNLSASAGIAIDDRYILMIGGDNGETFHEIETLIFKINNEKSPIKKKALTAEKDKIVAQHKGFSRNLLLYDTQTDRWSSIGQYPFMAQVTTNAVQWQNKIIISNGEIKPGVRTPAVIVGTIQPEQANDKE